MVLAQHLFELHRASTYQAKLVDMDSKGAQLAEVPGL